MTNENAPTTRIDRSFKMAAGALLVLGLVLAVIGLATSSGDPLALQHSYMFGWVYWASLTFGCLGLCLLHHCCRGNWGFPVLRIFEAGGGWVNVLLFGLLFSPIALVWRRDFYPWANPERVALDPILQHKSGYLNDSAWLVRFVLYFAVLVFLAWRYQSWTKLEEKTGDQKWWKLRQFWGGASLVVFVFVSNFMWTDWLMSQYPHWYSTIYGVWFVVSSALMAFSIAAIVLGTQSDKAPYNRVVSPWLTKDIGNWMLTFTMLWAYFSFSQYLIIWSGNLPEFTEYFIRRAEGGWGLWGSLLIPLHFFLPFLLLLSPRMKKVPRLLATVGFVILAVRLMDTMYHVLPIWKPTVGAINALDLGMFCLFGALWCGLFGFQIAQAPLLTARAPALKEAVDHA